MRKNLLLLIYLACTLPVAQAQSAKELAAAYADLSLFETPMALSLKKGIKKGDIEKIKNDQLRETARLLFTKQYNTKYRMASYEAYLTPSTLGQQLMIGDGYSKYENITGIYLPIGKHIVLVDHIAQDKEVNLVIPNWNRRAPEGIEPTKDPAGWGIVKQQFSLHNGVNIIEVKDFDGLAYLDYFTDTPEEAKPVQVHFPASLINGYFDIAMHNNTDWNNLINNAVYPIIDAKGKHIQIAYPAADCKTYAYNRGVELISNYDSLVYRQHRVMGLVKYNKVPNNHILARVNYNYYMFRDGDGVAYMGTEPGNAMPLVVDPDRVISGDPCWGFSHEVGHVHQLRPAFNWGGLGEVSNNVFTMYVTTSFGVESRLWGQDNYQKARDSIINRKISYLQDDDVFNRLVPFWQLQLYFSGAGGNPDFYPDLFEAFRTEGTGDHASGRRSRRTGGWGDRGSNPAQYQLTFVKTACKIGKVDLTEFFDQYGFFYVGDFDYNDYGNYSYSMTQEMVDTCKAEIKAMNLPKPTVDISKLSD
ncbi:M60 family metallopeptidase [Parapedobacter tibetensis]|uniref:M60 family metallopeptidase n=1 Tax=Parapedobacter tibetensis TaxID=2972951 RepID=UPI00214D1842|nr:M60 family metallopeptidase [Parapedobacter tibetensis]